MKKVERVLDVACYIYKEFTREMHHKIEEIKLHQLLYFAQRESFVQTAQPLFEEEFEGQKCGPVCIPVRKVFRQGQFENKESFEEIKQNSKDIVQKVLEQYGSKSSWSLSDIIHFEYSWIQSQKEQGNSLVLLKDIQVDANRIRERRKALRQKRTNSGTKPIPIINAAEVEESTECVDVVAEIKKIQEDLKRRNKGLCSIL